MRVLVTGSRFWSSSGMVYSSPIAEAAGVEVALIRHPTKEDGS